VVSENQRDQAAKKPRLGRVLGEIDANGRQGLGGGQEYLFRDARRPWRALLGPMFGSGHGVCCSPVEGENRSAGLFANKSLRSPHYPCTFLICCQRLDSTPEKNKPASGDGA
jgi:hypothetical protein